MCLFSKRYAIRRQTAVSIFPDWHDRLLLKLKKMEGKVKLTVQLTILEKGDAVTSDIELWLSPNDTIGTLKAQLESQDLLPSESDGHQASFSVEIRETAASSKLLNDEETIPSINVLHVTVVHRSKNITLSLVYITVC